MFDESLGAEPLIIVVEDEPSLREDMVEYLESRGYRVQAAGSAAELDRLSSQEWPELLLLDINLPDETGFSIAQRYRGRGQVGIVMLTVRGAIEDRIEGLDSGADAYLVKNADLREIEANVRAVIRRLREKSKGDSGSFEAVAPEKPWSFDYMARKVEAPNGKSSRLTASEASFLNVLVQTAGRSFTRAELATGMGKNSSVDSDRSIDAMVMRLRRKVQSDTEMGLPVGMIYGIGYATTAPFQLVVRSLPPPTNIQLSIFPKK